MGFFHQLPVQIPCNYQKEPIYSNEVTVIAPAGTLQEAFFDPVAVGTSVKADAANGVLKPTSFTVGSTATEITSLEWSNNKVVLTLDTYVSLSGYILTLIDTDGSVTLTLAGADATVNSAAGTYSWPATTQPWENGDKLMAAHPQACGGLRGPQPEGGHIRNQNRHQRRVDRRRNLRRRLFRSGVQQRGTS